MPYTALIIGAGAIAGGYDRPEHPHILTHAHAYTCNPHIQLLGFYDIEQSRAKSMAQTWGGCAFGSLSDAQHADIISICTPDDCHLQSVQEALALQPKILFLEKPAGSTPEDVSALVRIAKHTPIQVNYSRRFIPEFQNLAERIAHGEFERFLKGSGYYGKGYKHNGSHMRDIVEFLLGPIKKVTEHAQDVDFYPQDPTKDVSLQFTHGTLYMQGVDCRCVTIFELDLIFEKYRVRIVDGGRNIEEYAIIPDPVYADYSIFSLVKKYSCQSHAALNQAVKNIVNFLQKKETLLSPMRDFL